MYLSIATETKERLEHSFVSMFRAIALAVMLVPGHKPVPSPEHVP